jgi:hypothetical protein
MQPKERMDCFAALAMPMLIDRLHYLKPRSK